MKEALANETERNQQAAGKAEGDVRISDLPVMGEGVEDLSLSDNNPHVGVEAIMGKALDEPEYEVVNDEQGRPIKIYGYSGNSSAGSVAHTDRGDMSISDIIDLRNGVPRGTTSRDLAIDPGIRARTRLETRGQKIKRAAVRTYLILLTLLVAVVGGLGYYIYHQTFEVPGKRLTDYRPCSYVDEKLGLEITGRREFSYLERSLFGVHYRLEKDISERTQIDIRGEAITAVGLTGDKAKPFWAKFADMGERGIMILDPANQYVFTTKKKAVVIDYDQFCR